MTSVLHSKRRPRALRRGLSGAFLVLFGAASIAQAAVNISGKPTKNMSCSAGVCSPTAKSAVLNAGDLANMLRAADVTVTTGSGAITIEITSALSWASASRLTLDANCNVSVKAPVTVAGPGGLTIVTNIGGSGCDLLFFPGGKVGFWDLSSSLVINGESFTLANTIAELADAIRARASGAFALARDYDASSHKFKRSPICAKFYGQFEGLGHSIDNLTILNSTDVCVGLFGQVGSRHHTEAVLRNIILKDAYVSSTVQSGGVGTLVGCYTGTISNATATGRVLSSGGSGAVGGLAGGDTHNFWGTIQRSHADVEVWATRDFGAVGGLVGSGLYINQSYALGSVTAGYGAWAGGLAGECEACWQDFATGTVSGGAYSYVGGLVGSGNTVWDSYAISSATGGDNSSVGGFVGSIVQDIARSYSLGGASGGINSRVGGFAGYDSYGDSADYWDLDTSGLSEGCGQGNCTGITSLSDAQLKSGLPSGFDPAVWGQNASINNGYPYLLANPPP